MENQHILIFSVIAPFIAGILLMCLSKILPSSIKKIIAFAGFTVPLFATIYLFCKFDKSYLDFQFSSIIPIFGNLALPFGVNPISMCMLLMAAIVSFSAGFYALFSDIQKKNIYLILILFMQCGLMGIFASTDIIASYVFHEFALIPSFISILIWGKSGKKTVAMQMAIYLTFGAMLSLAGIIGLILHFGSQGSSFYDLANSFTTNPEGFLNANVIFALLLFGLGTLVSLFPFYSWAPKTYATAPASIAMMHSGVLKKFGLYLMVQVIILFLPNQVIDWSMIIAVLALINTVIIGLITIAQKDLKLMLGYSSVSHMGICFLAIASFSYSAIMGSVVMMFAHGLTVASLFLLADVIEKKTGTTKFENLGSLMSKTPILAGLFCASIFASIGLPGFAGFWGELTIFVSLWQFSKVITIIACTGLIISAIYGLKAIANIFFGSPSKYMQNKLSSLTDINFYAKFATVILLIALIIVGIYPKLLTSKLNIYATTEIQEHTQIQD